MPTKRALLVIDVQHLFCQGEYEAWHIAQVVGRINGLSGKARSANAPVIFVQHESKGGLLRHGSDAWQLASGLVVEPGDVRMRKTTPDSFLRTELAHLLEEREVESLVVCGLQTEFCVDTTTRRALALGYPVMLAADGHTTLDGTHLSAEQIIEHHNITLSSIVSFGPRAQPMMSSDISFVA
ncbi:MAG: cysteine hydrolase [Burkholderiales bacterium]|nr:cysteine hydrolase [Burkholderiales bacterium]